MSRFPSKKHKISEPVSIVAHQLKTPVSFLGGCLEVLISEEIGEVNEKQKEYLGDALENVKIMKKIINNLLDVSKIEESKYNVNPQPTDLVEMIDEIIKDFEPLIRASNCQVSFKKPEDFPSVCVDPFKIKQVIEDLLTNALHYKSTGPGKVAIGLEKKGDKILFSCKDNGIGIPKKEFDEVFTKFYRSEEAVDLDPSGTGLGLYIDKAIIELNGGEIWFEKNKGKGMTFYFTLPISK